jgi:hypothetical protein
MVNRKAAQKPSAKRKPTKKLNKPADGELLRHILPTVRTSTQTLGVLSSPPQQLPIRTLPKVRRPDQNISGGEQSGSRMLKAVQPIPRSLLS